MVTSTQLEPCSIDGCSKKKWGIIFDAEVLKTSSANPLFHLENQHNLKMHASGDDFDNGSTGILN